MSLATELTERGFIYQFSGDSLEEVLDSGEKRTVYLGIDPTAEAIHVGNLVPYMLLNHLMNAGHKVILLIGGGTALIGDPGGKSEERPFVDESVIAEQASKMEAGVRKFVSDEVAFVNNHDWLKELNMITFLRDVGKHFTVNAMIKKDIVANRLTDDNSISYTEFSYSLLQAYDFAYLHREHGCDMQIGGSDQWSNIIAGVDYVRRTAGDTVYGLTMPLVVDKATGKKFGKSEGNAIWLNPEMTTPYAFYQFWLNTSDESVIDYLKLFTFLPLEEIGEIERVHTENPGARSAQKKLAQVVTGFVHGEEEATAAEHVSELLFGEGGGELSESEEQILFDNAPTCEVQNGTALLDVLVESNLAGSKREARTFVEDGAVSIGGEKVTDLEATVNGERFVIMKRGKKNLSVIRFV